LILINRRRAADATLAAMMTRLSSSSDGRGPALTALVAEWAERNPKIRRAWGYDDSQAPGIAIGLELQPVADSGETSVVWLAHCEKWQRELEALTGQAVDLGWFDPDVNQPVPGQVRTLIYERLSR
jgi:hypothetical protein